MTTIESQAIYRKRAAYYDALYGRLPYQENAERVRELLHANDIADGSTVLEAGCGTGAYLVHLRQWFDVSGFDLNDGMLEIARVKLPDITLFNADMAGFAVDTPFDALVCLFSSIAYVYPEDRLRQATQCFARAVRPGGVVLVEPWIAPEEFRPGHVAMDTYSDDDLHLCRMVVSNQQGELGRFRFHWLVARAGAAEVEHFIEEHETWICPRGTLIDAFDDAGFDCRFDQDGLSLGRGLLIGRRRA